MRRAEFGIESNGLLEHFRCALIFALHEINNSQIVVGIRQFRSAADDLEIQPLGGGKITARPRALGFLVELLDPAEVLRTTRHGNERPRHYDRPKETLACIQPAPSSPGVGA